MHTTAHPDDENNGLLVMLNRGQGYPDRAGDGDARQRRTERDRPGDFRSARRPADRRAGRAASLRRRRAVLHARGRLRLLVQPRRDVREVGPRRDHRRLRAADSHDPSRRDHHAAADRQRRRPASHGVGGDHARRLQAGRRSDEVSRSRSRTGLRPWQPRKLYHSAGFGFPGEPADAGHGSTRVNSGVYDPLLGKTYAEIGTEARSMHKCQGMGQLLSLPIAGVRRPAISSSRRRCRRRRRRTKRRCSTASTPA